MLFEAEDRVRGGVNTTVSPPATILVLLSIRAMDLPGTRELRDLDSVEISKNQMNRSLSICQLDDVVPVSHRPLHVERKILSHETMDVDQRNCPNTPAEEAVDECLGDSPK